MPRLNSLPGTFLLMLHSKTIIGIQNVAITYISYFIRAVSVPSLKLLPCTLLLMIHGRTIIGIQLTSVISLRVVSALRLKSLPGTLLLMVHGRTIIGIQDIAITYISNFIKSCISTETEVTTWYIVADGTR